MMEKEKILKNLKKLCMSTGYAYAYIGLCCEAKAITNAKNSERTYIAEDKEKRDLILETEIIMIKNLMIQANFIEVSMQLITEKEIKEKIEKTKDLLDELRKEIQKDLCKKLNKIKDESIKEINELLLTKAMSEELLYEPGPALTLQYKEFSEEQYQNNKRWIKELKDIEVDHLQLLISKIVQNIYMMAYPMSRMLDEDAFRKFETERNQKANFNRYQIILRTTIISKRLISEQTKISESVIEKILNEFSIKSTPVQSGYEVYGDEDQFETNPIIKLSDDEYILIDPDSLYKAYYLKMEEWAKGTKHEENQQRNKAKFLESKTTKLIKKVYKNAVYENAIIKNKKTGQTYEIDALIMHCNVAILIEAKAGRMREYSSKGSVESITNNFKNIIGKGGLQAINFSKLLLSEENILRDKNGEVINDSRKIKSVYPIVITYHEYPGINNQMNLLLNQDEHPNIKKVYAIDLFTWDILCEFLDNPYYFINFLYKISEYRENLIYKDQIEILANYIKSNILLNNYTSKISIDEVPLIETEKKHKIELNQSLMQRKGIPKEIKEADKILEQAFGNSMPLPNYPKTPRGILTEDKDKLVNKLIESITKIDQIDSQDLFNILMEMDTEEQNKLNGTLENMRKEAKDTNKDKSNKYLETPVFAVNYKESVILMHARNHSLEVARTKLISHAEIIKYDRKQDACYALLLDFENKENIIDAIYVIDQKWQKDSKMEEYINKRIKNFPYSDKPI